MELIRPTEAKGILITGRRWKIRKRNAKKDYRGKASGIKGQGHERQTAVRSGVGRIDVLIQLGFGRRYNYHCGAP